MNASNTRLQYALLGENTSPQIVDDWGDNLMYLGYCLPTCTGTTDNRWAIKRVETTTVEDEDGTTHTVQTILWAGGAQRYIYAWADRASLDYLISEYQTTDLSLD